MSTAPTTLNFACASNATSTNAALVYPYPELTYQIAKAIYHDDLYDVGDCVPPYALVKRAARVLSNAAISLQGIVIDPYAGEIQITWKNRQNGRRVKAMFGPGENALSVYHEQKLANRVVEHNLIPNASDQNLANWVRWCFAAA